nr:SPFH domain-containing protein [Acidobacteriota bacterium]
MIRERQINALPGLPVLFVLLFALGLTAWGAVEAGNHGSVPLLIACLLGMVLEVVLMAGLFVVNPNEGKVLQLFGSYVGTASNPGLRWANPLYTKKRVSQRVRNFESAKLKVNDNEGNPIEIAAVVVWKVIDTAEAVFEVDDYNNYVKVQS